VLNFPSDRLRTKRTKFGPHEYFSLYGSSICTSGLCCNPWFEIGN